MADYIITLDDDQDVSIGSPDYNIGVNYEITFQKYTISEFNS